MKGLFWGDPKEAANEYGHRCGFDIIIRLKSEHIEALQAGKVLAWNDTEYSTFVILDNDDKEPSERGE